MASAHFGGAFTVHHAHLVPEGIAGFLNAFGMLADKLVGGDHLATCWHEA
jgi:hypothetical protein